MEHLWAPWRLQYIKGDRPEEPSAPRDEGCFLCRYREETTDEENLVVLRGRHTFVVLNRYPYNNGHLLVAPLAHKGELDELNDVELLESMQALQRLSGMLRRLMNPDGFNLGANLGRVAGAGLPGHLHWHLVPRWNGDTNFMTVVGDTKVIPQSLAALYELLAEALRGEGTR